MENAGSISNEVAKELAYKEYDKYSSTLYTYSMEDNKQKILVVCSFSSKNEKWKVPSGFDLETAELLLSNYDHLDTILKPYETRVYKWDKEN